jgi:hypothetical protein
LEDFLDRPVQPEVAILDPSLPESYAPYPNRNAFLLGEWYWTGGVQKSKADFKALLDIIGSEGYSSNDVRAVPWDLINQKLVEEDPQIAVNGGWETTKVTISVPFHVRRLRDPLPGRTAAPQDYTIPFAHRKITSIIREKLCSASFRYFHLEPFELYWQRPGNSLRMSFELYNSPDFFETHRQLQDSPLEKVLELRDGVQVLVDCQLPRYIVALAWSSDAMMLTNFGNQKLWPLYLGFGNDSKYRRREPSQNLYYHVAYFQSVTISYCSRNHILTSLQLPEAFKDFAKEQTSGGLKPSPAFFAHCARELAHAQWAALIDDELVNACEHGMVVTCNDGIVRRVYPRFFTYSADYPEKLVDLGLAYFPLMTSSTESFSLPSATQGIALVPSAL